MPRYDPAGHELLTPAAKRLDPTSLSAEADTAEDLLRRGSSRLADTEFEPGTPDYKRAVRAVAYQVNYQVEAGVDGEVYGSGSRGGRQFGFRGGVLNPMPVVSPRAQAIVDGLISAQGDPGNWPIAGGLR